LQVCGVINTKLANITIVSYDLVSHMQIMHILVGCLQCSDTVSLVSLHLVHKKMKIKHFERQMCNPGKPGKCHLNGCICIREFTGKKLAALCDMLLKCCLCVAIGRHVKWAQQHCVSQCWRSVWGCCYWWRQVFSAVLLDYMIATLLCMLYVIILLL